MPKKIVAKKYVVNYKTVNTLLKAKKKELEKLQKKVNLVGKLDLQLQIKAMDLLIQKCKTGKMTATYNGA